MNNIRVNFENTCGKVKPMHAVNNGPIYKFAVDQRITNIEPWREAGIPYARTHDAAFCATYGGEHTVDVNNIFTNFDADPYDPASYDFVLTDEYMQIIAHGGSDKAIYVKKYVLNGKQIKGTTITLIADGADESSAIEGLAELVDSEFSEQ